MKVLWLAKLGCGHVVRNGPATPYGYVPEIGLVMNCPVCVEESVKMKRRRFSAGASGDVDVDESKVHAVATVVDVVETGPLPDPRTGRVMAW